MPAAKAFSFTGDGSFIAEGLFLSDTVVEFVLFSYTSKQSRAGQLDGDESYPWLRPLLSVAWMPIFDYILYAITVQYTLP